MEDSFASFADLLEDGTNEELDDYGRLYEYNKFADASIWDGVFDNRQETPSSVASQTQDAEVVDVSSSNELQNILPDDLAEASSQFRTSFQSAASPQIAPPDPELQAEMLELLSIFQVVYENKSAIDTPSLLKKCIHMCERITDRFYQLPQVVAMHEQAKILLQMFENEEAGSSLTRSNPSSNSATGNSTLSGRSHRQKLMADVKEALDRVDCDANERRLFKDPDEGREVNGVYICKGIWYCKMHIEQEQCRQCGVDYRLLNQVHRSRTEEAQMDDILRKEQQRLEELEHRRVLLSRPDSVIQGGLTDVHIHQDAEDFQSIGRDLNEELARAREKDKAISLRFSPLFQIFEERRLVL
ncbi:uncharacterized protein [Physcomitrium patens]|uniref:Uncharacterized protein n=1 Tax=Physcomitrium patens TaxID=3218 RepID=A0A7I4FMY7_PHYPA|nr:uncharacterized protein LOC112279321 isoform X3 [Physcomitrium patens]|eukprot:XP_024369429.1 uncharacterized protein LOC112279321 isoform X3 [Physcomitrella patens]